MVQATDHTASWNAFWLLRGYSQRHFTAVHFGCSATHCAMYGCAAMVHRRNETSEEKTRWVSSQVVGESTAQTVTINSIGVMPDIPELRLTMITQKATVTNAAKFHYPVKSRNWAARQP
jgi:hypothetical protein